ncbi:unnamed protein product [Didymodactylos carnosus]|uniref:Uncharacterized protein n=1 Tax=Didymodactylos carnosus TaxID=1234261 RepID=A0A8S2E2V5_9BILA|nr:unnamed protein product [Didymodactylos carnosus]CAF3892316.1 unnamed protein product [Didymodactylos carnosus]
MKKKLRLTKKSQFTSLPLDNERSQYLTRLAAEFLIYNLLPMSLVECPKLQTIFTQIEPSYGLPCRKYMMKTVLEKMYNDTRAQVANELTNTNDWFGCGDHLINLCVQDALKLCEISEALTSIRKVVSHVKNSHLAGEHFHQQQFHLNLTERQLLSGLVTRWNSTYYMLERAIDERESITLCLEEKSFQKHLNQAKLSTGISWDLLTQIKVS